MRWFRRAAALRPELDQLDDEVGEALIFLDNALRIAEAAGAHWRPQSRLARTALKAINWR